jgi:hypothetical protein
MYLYHRFGLYLVCMNVVCCATLLCMETKKPEEQVQLIINVPPQLPSPVACAIELEQARRAYSQLRLSLSQRIFGSTEEHDLAATITALRLQKKRSKMEQVQRYVNLNLAKASDVVVDKGTGCHTLSTNHGRANSQKGSLLTGFSRISPATWRNVSLIDLRNGDLEILPLHKFVEWCSALTELTARNNKIRSITHASRQCPYDVAVSPDRRTYNGLQKLDISHNQLTEFNFDALFEACPTMKHIDLSHNKNLQNIILEGTVPCDLSGVSTCCGSSVQECILPTIKAVHTLLSTEENNTKFKKAYVQTLLGVRAESAGVAGLGLSLIPTLAGLTLVFYLSPDTLPMLVDRIAVGSITVLGGFFLGGPIGHISGRYAVTPQMIKTFEERAAQHIIYKEVV